MTPLDITDSTRAAIVTALADGDFEGAVELVFEAFPDCTRDEAVDMVEEIDKEES